ncbi:MAG: ORF6N domain-containing protein [Chitinispirillales bacterium]|jgi:phage regulator Rha-like protein|nr:ORF6N domain-containing protein [Chitinispirillales bacterium]
MNDIIQTNQVENLIITIRNERVIMDSDVAAAYGVETKEINQAVKNNPDKFPEGYIFELNQDEKNEVVKNFDHLDKLKFSHAVPKAFTEKGLYMLATILKSPKATQTTIAIVETFAKMRDLSRSIAELSKKPGKERQNYLMQRSGEIISDILGSNLDISDTETDIEINFAMLKLKHKVHRKNRDGQIKAS